MDALVTTHWLAGEIGAADLRIIDATLVDGSTGRDAAAEFRAAHLPGAVFLDLATLRDAGSDLPNMLPSAAVFAERMTALGLGADDRIIVYDASPWHSAARAWWMLRLFGARNVAILDGGIARWREEGRALERGDAGTTRRSFDPGRGNGTVRTLAEMRTTREQVVDARSAARFAGSEPDPRPGVAAGHLPGSANLPYPRLFAADGRWKGGEALAAAFADAGIDLARPTVATCGSGITAAVLVFGAHLLGRDMALYDGSWSEWGADAATPKATA